MRSAIIGTGFMGRVHTRSVRAAGGDVVAYAGRELARTRAAADAAGVPLALDAATLVEHPDVDVVHICAPNSQHVDLATAAIRAGKHVVCEKPLAMSIDEADELDRLAREAGVVNVVPFIYRYYPAVREARARIQSTRERIWLAHGHYLQDWLAEKGAYNWRVHEGRSRAFADIGVHWCDLFEFVSGHRITRLSAQFAQAHPRRTAPSGEVAVRTEDAVTMLFETDRGARGSLVVSQASPGRKNRLWIELDGTDSSYSFDQENPDRLEVGRQDGTLIVPKGAETTAHPDVVAPYLSLPSGHPQGYLDSFIALMAEVDRAVRGETVAGLPTFADGARAAAITEAVIASAENGSWVAPAAAPLRRIA